MISALERESVRLRIDGTRVAMHQGLYKGYLEKCIFGLPVTVNADGIFQSVKHRYIYVYI